MLLEPPHNRKRLTISRISQSPKVKMRSTKPVNLWLKKRNDQLRPQCHNVCHSKAGFHLSNPIFHLKNPRPNNPTGLLVVPLMQWAHYHLHTWAHAMASVGWPFSLFFLVITFQTHSNPFLFLEPSSLAQAPGNSPLLQMPTDLILYTSISN